MGMNSGNLFESALGEAGVGLRVHTEPYLGVHVDVVLPCSSFDEGPVKEVSVIRDVH